MMILPYFPENRASIGALSMSLAADSRTRFVLTAALRLARNVGNAEAVAEQATVQVFDRLASNDYALVRSYIGYGKFPSELVRLTQQAPVLAEARAAAEGATGEEVNRLLESVADTSGAPVLLPLTHMMLAAVAGAFITGDLFNLYVWFEVMLICSLGLFAIGGRLDQLDASFKYLVLNLLGTLLLLIDGLFGRR